MWTNSPSSRTHGNTTEAEQGSKVILAMPASGAVWALGSNNALDHTRMSLRLSNPYVALHAFFRSLCCNVQLRFNADMLLPLIFKFKFKKQPEGSETPGGYGTLHELAALKFIPLLVARQPGSPT